MHGGNRVVSRGGSRGETPRGIRLHKGEAVLDGPKGSIRSDVEIRLEWAPDPRVEFSLSGGIELVGATLSGREDLIIKLGGSVPIAVRPLSWNPRWRARQTTNASTVVWGMVNPCSVGTTTGMRQIEFGLVNLQGVDGGTILEADEWQLDLQSSNTEFRRNGYETTHTGKLVRRDGASFGSEDASDVLASLMHCLAFVSGGWVGVLRPIGRSAAGRIRWQRWEVTSTDDIRLHRRWLPANTAGESALSSFWPGFWRRWRTKDGQAAIQALVPIFIEAAQIATPEAGLVLDQVGLELLSWTVVVEELTMISGDGHEKLTAADRIRLLLTPNGIDLSVPRSLSDLCLAQPRSGNWSDGAHAITDIRNSAVHPRKRRQSQVGNAAIVQAGTLAHSYLLRALLSYLGYSGKYFNRVLREYVSAP